jgi:hypothetical protein
MTVNRKDVFQTNPADLERFKISENWAKRDGSIVCADEPVLVTVVADGQNAEEAEKHSVKPDVIYGLALNDMAEFVDKIGVGYTFLAGVVSDHPEEVYRMPGGQIINALVMAKSVGLSEEAKKAGACFEQVVFFQALSRFAKKQITKSS